MIADVTGVILAGGKSSRMGQDKAMLLYQGKPLIERVFFTLSSIFERVLLSVNDLQAYPSVPATKVLDHYAEIGPLGGITSVLETGENKIFCVACDMPFLDGRLIEYLCGFDGYDSVLPRWQGRAQTLHALYSTSLISIFRNAISAGRYKITDALAGVNDIKYVEEAELESFNPALVFQNINTPDEYGKLLR